VALYAELHRHLGGSVVPRILWRFLQKEQSELLTQFGDYGTFEEFYTRPRNTLEEYLKLHSMVEHVQTAESLPYFIYRLLRGAYVFENVAYLELRYTPYYRTDDRLGETDRIDQMNQIVSIVGEASRLVEYPIVTSQILCMHTKLSYAANKAIVDLAIDRREFVCGIDLAGSDRLYGERMEEFIALYAYARNNGVNTTGHLYETPHGCHAELLPYLMRIGHGIQIPLLHPELLPEIAANKQCLEICPSTYPKTGTLKDIAELKPVFDRAFDAGVDIAICTDNAGLHNVRLTAEYENLLTADIIGFEELRACQDAAFRHAFAWRYAERPAAMLGGLLQAEVDRRGISCDIDDRADLGRIAANL
jgi:adenosine deaminase